MRKEIKVPSVGESVSEAEIESWLKQEGDYVRKGDILVILETDKASMEIPAEINGKLSVLKKKGEKVQVGQIIAYLEPAKEPSMDSSQQQDQSQSSQAKEETSQAGSPPENASPSTSSTKATSKPIHKSSPDLAGSENLSPSVRRLVEQNQLNPSSIQGTGKGGRLSKEDILKALKESPDNPNISLESSSPLPQTQADQKREPMTLLRKKVAERLVYSQQSTATLSTFNEVDMSNIMNIRKKYKDIFLKKQNVKLGLMGFFVKAVVSALKEYPRIQAFIEGTDVVYNKSCHIGIAVSTDKGLVVPVIRYADQLSLAEIEKQILYYSEKAKNRKLTPDDLLSGTFTISNGGVFGSLLSTPILNPPQSGILGMHKIEQRPVAINNEVQIRPMMYLTLSYDHRMVDGRESVGFLVKVKEGIEDPTRLLINI